jgi:outer membrane protein OmpA-like peptidoglycan-associated protein
MAIFQKKSGGGAGSGQTTGQGSVNSNYLKECREDNPEPSTQDAAATATLLNCKIDTPPEKLVVDQPFEMSVEATGEGVAGAAITFRLFCAIASADGKETFEDQSAVWSARAKDGKATFRGELLSPKKSVPLGTKLKYYVQASHPNAKEKADSPKVEAIFGKPPEVLAIWSLGAVHFGFGSSFIMPTVAAEVSHLKKLLDQHSGSALAIFGHADPVGDDDSNKKLSGRRAYALHCLLTRNADGWVELSKGIEGDKWGAKAHQAILGQLKDSSGAPFYGGSIHGNDDTQTKAAIEAYQKSAKLKADGIVGPQTKKSLYAAYMDQLCEVKLKPDDFVGDPSDKLVQWACSGCSEFNPVVVFSKSDEDAFKSSGNKAERDAKNAPNRRASLFLFPATAKGPGKVTFPCPAWSDGTASCKKQLFPDADKRRNPTDAERTWEAAKDTFGCQFYSAIATKENQVAKPSSDANYVDIAIFERHFVEGHHLPNMANDEFLMALAGIIESHDKQKKCALDIHPNLAVTNQDIMTQRLQLVECIIHNDVELWCKLMEKSTTLDIQNFLKYFVSKGWYCDPGPLDGMDGPKTRSAVKEFQESCNIVWGMSLAKDGICGPKTWAAVLKTLRAIVTPVGDHSKQEPNTSGMPKVSNV